MALPSSPKRNRSVAENLEKVKAYLINHISRELEVNPPPINQRREAITRLLEDVYSKSQISLPDTLRTQVFRDVMDDMLGYGPIQPLLEDPEITEVIGGRQKLWIDDLEFNEERGRFVPRNATMRDVATMWRS